MMIAQPMMQPAAVPAAAAGASDAEGSDGSPSKRKRTKVTTASIAITKIPKIQLLDAVEVVSSKVLDATLTGNCDQDSLAVILWMLNRMLPTMKVTDLRCEYYDEVFISFKKAADRVKEEDPAAWNFMVSKIVTLLGSHQETELLQYALELGFEPDWLAAKKKAKREKVSKRMASMMDSASKVANGEEELCESLVSQLNYFI